MEINFKEDIQAADLASVIENLIADGYAIRFVGFAQDTQRFTVLGTKP